MNQPLTSIDRILQNCNSFITLPPLTSQSIEDFMPPAFKELNQDNVTPEKLILALDDSQSLFKTLIFQHIPYPEKYSPLVIKHLISEGESAALFLPDEFFSNIDSHELDDIIDCIIQKETQKEETLLNWNSIVTSVSKHPKSMIAHAPRHSTSIMSGATASIMPLPAKWESFTAEKKNPLPKHLDLFLKIVKNPDYYAAYSDNFSEFQNLEETLTLETIKSLFHFKIEMDMKKDIPSATKPVKISKF